MRTPKGLSALLLVLFDHHREKELLKQRNSDQMDEVKIAVWKTSWFKLCSSWLTQRLYGLEAYFIADILLVEALCLASPSCGGLKGLQGWLWKVRKWCILFSLKMMQSDDFICSFFFSVHTWMRSNIFRRQAVSPKVLPFLVDVYLNSSPDKKGRCPFWDCCYPLQNFSSITAKIQDVIYPFIILSYKIKN